MWQPGMTLADVEKEAILSALKFYRDNKTQTANALGVTTKTIANKLAEYASVPEGASSEESVWGRLPSGISPTKGTASKQEDHEAEGGVHMESAPEVSSEQAVPAVRERQEVQALPSARASLGTSRGVR